MDFREYQTQAELTDQVPGKGNDSLMVPLLGLAGETGSLLTEYKKLLRDGGTYRIFDERIQEELGDILWYVSNVATKAGLNLDEIASQNLRKVRDRWLGREGNTSFKLFDEDFPESEQLPRQFQITFSKDPERPEKIVLCMNGESVGNSLTDNTYGDDGYRYHDVFHLAYAAVLGWSPVIRKLLNRKRKSKPVVDEVEDGGRATAIEEGISALVFAYAQRREFLENVKTIDYELLKNIKDLTSHLEVRHCSLKQWETAILHGYEVWRVIRQHARGTVLGDLRLGTFMFSQP